MKYQIAVRSLETADLDYPGDIVATFSAETMKECEEWFNDNFDINDYSATYE